MTNYRLSKNSLKAPNDLLKHVVRLTRTKNNVQFVLKWHCMLQSNRDSNRPYDVKQCFAAWTCIFGVVVMNESNMASYFSKSGNLNGSNWHDCVLMWLGCRVVARAICLISQIPNFYFFPTSTTGRQFGFEGDYNSHTAFWACYVIMHHMSLSLFPLWMINNIRDWWTTFKAIFFTLLIFN